MKGLNVCDECGYIFSGEPNIIGNSEELVVICDACYDEYYGQTSQPDYEGFCEHYEEYNRLGVPISIDDLKKLANKYNCEIPMILGGELIFKTYEQNTENREDNSNP